MHVIVPGKFTPLDQQAVKEVIAKSQRGKRY
jgi:hypothetical protein